MNVYMKRFAKTLAAKLFQILFRAGLERLMERYTQYQNTKLITYNYDSLEIIGITSNYI